MTNPLRVVIVDDEPLTRERIASFVAGAPRLELVAEARNGLEALDRITALEPDLVFLDVEMPELDGFGVVAALETTRAPAVIFVTAYEQYARQAFDVGAVDYLHKPVTPARFAAAVERAERRLQESAAARWEALVAGSILAARARGWKTRFVVREGNAHYFVPVDDVEWIDVADNYLRLHVGAKARFARGTMKNAEEELDPGRFIRIHRSAIVAIDRIRAIRSVDGVFVVELANGVQLKVSRQYSRRVSSLIAEGKP